MQLTSPQEQTESCDINQPIYSNYSNQSNSPIAAKQSSPLQDKSTNLNQLQQQMSRKVLKFDSVNPIQVQCDNCHTFNSSLVYIESTKYTYIFAAILILNCLCWVPFVQKKYFMKISHVCPQCDKLIGQYDYMSKKIEGLF